LKFDEIGYWSEIKLEIIRKYAAAYSTILSTRTRPRLKHLYIDAFAGAGIHLSKSTGEFVRGSPLNALYVKPPFVEYHFIDLNSSKTGHLRGLIGERSDVHVYEGDCNTILLNEVFPRARYKDYRRALCLLDPYGLHLDWNVIATAGQLKTVDMFLNFPVADINRNVLWSNPQGVREQDLQRMTAFWGDESWRNSAYSSPRKGKQRKDRREFSQALATNSGVCLRAQTLAHEEFQRCGRLLPHFCFTESRSKRYRSGYF
jgi:three-Cys-motif partner protein